MCTLFGVERVSESVWFIHSWKCWHLWTAPKQDISLKKIYEVHILVTSIWKKQKTEETTKQCILPQCLVEVHSCSFPTLIALLQTVWAKMILTPK